MKFSSDPKKWGSSGWKFLHTIAMYYPDEPTEMDRQHYKMFFLTLPHVLPCVACQEHLLEYMSRHIHTFNHAFENRFTLTMWLIDVHNAVNKRLNKRIVSYKQVISQHGTQLSHFFASHE